MSKFAKGLSAFKQGFSDRDNMSSSEIEYETDILKNKLATTKVNHILHLILSIITAGIWVIAWILISISVADEKRTYRKQLKALYERKSTSNNA